jgi:putative transposase
VVVRAVALVIIRRVLALVTRTPPDAHGVEIAVLRRHLSVLRPSVAGRGMPPADRMVLAILAQLLPGERWPIARV